MNESKAVRTERHHAGCPACSHKLVRATSRPQIYTCAKCDALFGDCYLGDSYTLVLPFMIPDSMEPFPPDAMRYYDFTCLGSKGVTRRHGWYDPATRLIVQVG